MSRHVRDAQYSKFIEQEESSMGTVLGPENTVFKDTSQSIEVYTHCPHLIWQLVDLEKWAWIVELLYVLMYQSPAMVQVFIPGFINAPLALGIVKHPGETLPSSQNKNSISLPWTVFIVR